MKRKWIFLLIAAVALIVLGGWSLYLTFINEPKNARATATVAPDEHVQTVNGETVVQVNADAQRASHIEVASLAAAVSQRQAYVTVLDLQPLFDLHSRLSAARADRTSAQAQTDTAKAQYERDRTLFSDNRNISLKALQNDSAAMQAAQAKLGSAIAAQHALEITLQQQYGEPIAVAAAMPASSLLSSLAEGQSILLRVTLPIDDKTTAPATITIDAPDGKAIPAQQVSVSMQGDPAIQGKSYLYVAKAFLPTGIHTIAHFPSGKVSSGLLIPGNAIVWYGGQSWAYIRTAPDRFTRRYVPSTADTGHGLIVTTGFHAGDQVVIQGAQLLLSEELRPKSIATQCKDPPECDD